MFILCWHSFFVVFVSPIYSKFISRHSQIAFKQTHTQTRAVALNFYTENKNIKIRKIGEKNSQQPNAKEIKQN